MASAQNGSLDRSFSRFWHTAIPVRDRSPAANAKGIARNDEGRWQLAAFEFVRRRFNAIQNVENQIAIMSCADDFLRRLLLFEIEFEDRIELLIGRQRLFIQLSRRKFRRRRLVD